MNATTRRGAIAALADRGPAALEDPSGAGLALAA
jgi:hypothetical protein